MGLLSGVKKESEEYLVELLDAADVETQRGAMLLAPNERNLQDLEESLPRRKAEYGLDDYVIGRDRLAEELAGLVDEHFAGALIMPDARHVQPATMIQELAGYAMSIGVAVCEEAQVLDWQAEAGGIRVETGRGSLQTNNLLIAGGGYVGRRWDSLWRKTLAVPSIAAATEELDEQFVKDLVPGRKLTVVNRFRGYNLRLSPDGRRILIAGPVADMPRTTEQNLRRLTRYFVGLFPALTDVSFSHCWTGISGITRNRGVHIGTIGDAWFVTGASGLANAAVAGRDAAAQLLGCGEATANSAVWPLRSAEWFWLSVIRNSAKWLDGLGRSRPR